MEESPRRCPLCGGPMPIPEVDEAAILRAQIVFLRQRLDKLERADISSPTPEAGAGTAAREQLQERIDRGLQHLEGGYGTEDRP